MEEPTAGHGRRAGLRTENMVLMSVTLDVSRLSGWLNAAAYCRRTPRHLEGTGGREAQGCVAALVVHAACTEKPAGHWARHARGVAHCKHEAHGRDA